MRMYDFILAAVRRSVGGLAVYRRRGCADYECRDRVFATPDRHMYYFLWGYEIFSMQPRAGGYIIRVTAAGYPTALTARRLRQIFAALKAAGLLEYPPVVRRSRGRIYVADVDVTYRKRRFFLKSGILYSLTDEKIEIKKEGDVECGL